jgi:taurine ABC transporter substrate-binding protein
MEEYTMKINFQFRNYKLILLCLLVIAVTSGCANKNETSSLNEKKEKVVIGYLTTPDPHSVAAQEKLFEKYMNAQIDWKAFDSGPAALTALASGDIQFMTEIGNPPTANAISKGVKVEVIWALGLYTTAEGLVVKADSAIHKLADLKGKKIALIKGSTSDLAFSTALKEKGIDPSGIDQINMSPPNIVAAWKTGNIDAAFIWDPSMTELIDSGGRVIITDKDQSAPIFNLAIVNSEWAASHKKLVEGYVRAEQAGYELLQSDPEKAYADMAKWNGITVESAKRQAKGFRFYSLKDQLTADGLGADGETGGSLVTKSLQLAAEASFRNKLITEVPKDLSKFVNNSYAKAVLDSNSK